MLESVRNYLLELTEGFGAGWNRFWFTRRDPFALGVMRLLTGLVAFYVIFTYGPDLETFFGENGLLTLENVKTLNTTLREPDGVWRFSYLDLLKTPSSLRAGYVAGLVVIGLFTIGLQSRIASILALLVVQSFIHRGPVLTAQVEPILVMVMFYLCLGPSGASLSIDAWLTKRSRSKAGFVDSGEVKLSAAANISTRLIQVHISLLYAVMGLSKLVAVGWWDGGGAWWLVARPESRLFDFSFLSDHIYIVNAWTHSIVLYELAFPVLIWNRLARPLMLTLGLVYLILLGLASGLLTFVAMLFIANLAFVAPTTLRAILGNSGKPPATAAA